MPAKVDEIVKSLKKDNPSWSDSKVYAIAWSTYNKMKGKK